MPDSKLRIVNSAPLTLDDGFALDVQFVLDSVLRVNNKFIELKTITESMSVNVFEIIDFRMLSGLVGETLVTDLSTNHEGLYKNPNIDGYPDLLNAATQDFRRDIESFQSSNPRAFIRYPHGGFEVKNTFGTKTANTDILPGGTRIGRIQKKLDWKAHHRYTNSLIGVYSDFIGGCPQIAAVMYSNRLEENDWKEKQNPKAGSTMTSFSVIERSGWKKLLDGIRICRVEYEYRQFFGFEETK